MTIETLHDPTTIGIPPSGKIFKFFTNDGAEYIKDSSGVTTFNWQPSITPLTSTGITTTDLVAGVDIFNQQVNDMEGYFFMEDSNTLTLSENSITFTEARTVSIDFEWIKSSGLDYTYYLQKNGVTFFTDTTSGGVVETIDEVIFAQGDVFSVVVEPTQFFTMLTQAQFTFTDKP